MFTEVPVTLVVNMSDLTVEGYLKYSELILMI